MNKKLYLFIFILLVILFSTQLKGLAQFEFPNKGGEWYVMTLTPESDWRVLPPAQIEKDTIIEDKQYSIMRFLDYRCALRNDNAYVYYINLNTSEPRELLLYNFNIEIGDTIKIFGYNMGHPHNLDSTIFKVVDIDYIFIKNEPTKRILLFDGKYGYPYWIDGIGSTWGPLYPLFHPEGEFETDLLCYKENGNSIYGSCHSNSTQTIEEDEKFGYFNFVEQKFIIIKPLNFNLSVYNPHGINVANFCGKHEQEIDLSHLIPGVYILKIRVNRQILTQKISIRNSSFHYDKNQYYE